MKVYCFLILSLLVFAGCVPGKSALSIKSNKKLDTTKMNPSVSSVQIVNNQLIINGVDLAEVSKIVVNGNSVSENFSIESKTATKVIANPVRNFSFDISKVFNLILSDASASTTFQINFSLCNATLGSAGFDCTAPLDNDVLTYDQLSSKWVPRALTGINYKGTWDANTAEPTSTAVGQYYIVNTANLPTYNIGDWIVWNGLSYDHIDKSSSGGDVATVFGRIGAVLPLEGDYNLDKLSDVDLSILPTTGQVLKYDGVKWIADNEAATGGAGSVTTTELADGSVTNVKIVSMATTKLTGTITSAQITDGTIVNADINAAAAIDYSKLNIPNTSIPYAKLNIADGDIPAAKISGLPAATSVLATSIVDGDTTHSPDGNSVFDALGLKLNLTGGILSVGTISGVPTPTNSDDVVNKGYADTQDALKASKAGDTFTGDVTFNTQIRLQDGGGAGYITIKAPASGTTSHTLTLPATVGTSGQVLSMTGIAGVLAWSTPSSSAIPSGTAGGDLSGTYPNPTITGLDATKIATGVVDNTEFNYLNGVTSSIQTQLTGKQATDATLTSLGGFNTNGIMVQTAADTFVGRSIAGTANRLTVTNGDGVAGNPKLDIPTALLPSPVIGDVGKFLKATGADTSVWTDLSSSDITTALGFTPINKAGDSITTGTFTLSGAAILRSLDPVGLTDVANKQYVDSYGQWTKSGNDVYRTTGNVGIGTATPNDGGTSSNVNRTYFTIMGPTGAGVLQLSSNEADGNNNQGNIEWVDKFASSADKRVGYINIFKNTATANNRGTFMAFGSKSDNGTTATERMRITEDGNLCVGCVNSTTSRLDIKGATNDSTANALNVRNFAGTALLAVRNDGFVGIGTASPSVKLEVSGDILSSGTVSSSAVVTGQLGVSGAVSAFPNTSIRNTAADGVSGTLYYDSSNVGRAFIGHINASVGAPYPVNTFGIMGVGTAITLGMDANEVMRVNTDGRVGIGITNPGYKLDVQGGGVNASGGYTQTSDIRLKTNIDYLNSQSALEKIVSLNGILYNWINVEKLGSDRQIGLVAQDVEKVFPEAVKKNSEGLLSVSYSNLVAPVIEAIKELNKRVISLFDMTSIQSREIASIKMENSLKDQKIKRLEKENLEIKARLDKIEKMLK